MKRYEIRSYGLHSEWEAVISEDGDWADYADVEKLIAENASLKCCGNCKHWSIINNNAYCAVHKCPHSRRYLCDGQWELPEDWRE